MTAEELRMDALLHYLDELAALDNGHNADVARRAAERLRSLESLAYIGDHHFPENTWKARHAEERDRAESAERANAEMRERFQWIVDLASGWDEHGALGPREPLSWESVARMAMDYARNGLLTPQEGQHGK